MIIQKGTILYGHKSLPLSFCTAAISGMKPNGTLNRGYGAMSFDVALTESMILDIHNFLEEARKICPVPTLVCRRTAEILRYDEGMKLDPHYDIPYCKEDFYPFVTAVNINEEYDGGLYFDCEDLEIKGAGSIVMSPSSFMHIHSVKEIKNGRRYSMLLDITYPEMLKRCTGPENWTEV